jgi:hypothetical protein
MRAKQEYKDCEHATWKILQCQTASIMQAYQETVQKSRIFPALCTLSVLSHTEVGA